MKLKNKEENFINIQAFTFYMKKIILTIPEFS